ncbi:hypothetical protein ATE84_2283 [Aquimarina sp. MAR_2010_214]|nr:hypothetical protein ATE84_2283 [Aquimarina sp. MAR_2010_214]
MKFKKRLFKSLTLLVTVSIALYALALVLVL